MEIRVPRPPKESFNKQRPVSDLIRKQVEHFRHVESKLSAVQRAGLPQGHIRTEQDAAQYIAAMTELLLATSAAATQSPARPIVMPARSTQPARGLVLAAAAESTESSASNPKDKRRASRTSRKGEKQ
jgi:hypothetical protein